MLFSEYHLLTLRPLSNAQKKKTNHDNFEGNETMVKFLVDNNIIEAEDRANLLQTCLKNDIYIPNLCYLNHAQHPFAACRLCFVEINGKPVTACTQKVTEGLQVQTNTSLVRELQKTAFRLLLSVHEIKCKECPANKQCDLQRIAKFLKIGLKSKGLEIRLKDPGLDSGHPYLFVDQNRCVLCGKCIQVCLKKHGHSYLTFAKRGFDTVISAYIEPDEIPLNFSGCTACIDICPVMAISLKKT
jgi:bidirectional [NiFe] hydrogenase diaphorase subunit